MPTVQGVLGPIDTADLGFTLMHEHIKSAIPGYELDSATRVDPAAELAQAVARLEELRALGVRTIVDPAPMEIGREPLLQRAAAEKSGTQVIIATGLYCETGRWFGGFPEYFKLRSVDEITETYVTEIEQGIGDTGIRAGIIKCATSSGEIRPNEEKALRAAARAAIATGVNITTHTTHGTMGPQQLDIFAAEGLDLKRVIIGHSCFNHDFRYHLSMLERGCYLCFDQVGTPMTTDELRAGTLAGLVALGWAHRIVLSHDAVCCFHPKFIPTTPEAEHARRERRPTAVSRDFLPRLRQMGVPESALHQMTVDNPRRFFEKD
jgi:phosphotriesterase-related protein